MIDQDLSKVEPTINGPFTPDLATPLSKFASFVKENGWSDELSAGLIGSCTNSSYEDMVIQLPVQHEDVIDLQIDTCGGLSSAGKIRWVEDAGPKLANSPLLKNPNLFLGSLPLYPRV